MTSYFTEYESLSNRELEVLRFASAGKSCRQTAQFMFISENTCETHRRNILTKLGASNMTEAVFLAVKKGLI